MDFDKFVKEVRVRGEFSPEEAIRATDATLSVLGERLKGGEPRDLGAQLPPELADAVPPRGPGERFDIEQFYLRVAEREGDGVTVADAREHARAVMSTLHDAVTPGEWDDIQAQLPRDYADLV
jgi:uncharacterized protein (DUF2267 family)